jgi:tRNA(fMet)-specific endonuclease VapC
VYLLDTNICIYAINHKPAHVMQRLVAAGREGVAISSITAAELAFGAVKSQRASTRPAVELFLATLRTLDWGGAAVWQYASARLALERSGLRIGERDLLIAAHGLALGYTVVTNNLSEFTRVPGLRCENWAEVV